MADSYPKHEKAVGSALADVGVHEQPMGSNRGPRVQVYQHATWLGGTGWPWCVAFLQYQWKQAGFVMPWRGAGAYALLDWAKTVGWAVPKGLAQPGDAVVFNIGSGHAGMLREKITGTTVKTVDGNVSDRVDIRERPLSLVRGFVHIPEQPVMPPPTPPVPIYEVVRSASGHQVVIFNGKLSTIGQKLPRFLQRNPSITIRRKKRR